MKLSAALLGLTLLTTPVLAQGLPDLAGREVVVVTENAYPPLQFCLLYTSDAADE